MAAVNLAQPAAPTFDFSTLGSPNKSAKEALARELNAKMFERTDQNYHYKLKDIQFVLNQLSRYNYAPNQSKIPWGDALLGIVALCDCMQRIGTRDTDEQHNTKKAVLAMLTFKDPSTGKVLNRKLLNAMMAHEDDSNKAKYVNKGLKRRDDFERTNDTIKLCHDVKRRQREGEYMS